MAKIVGDIAIAVEAETAGLIKGLNNGSVSVEDFGAKVERMGKRVRNAENRSSSFGRAFRNLGNVSNQTRARIQNTSFQLQDLAVQIQGGTSASRALSQQLPQLLGGFGAVGAAVGVLAGVGIPILAAAFETLSDDTDALAEKLDAVAKSSRSLNDELRASNLGVTADELTLLDAIKATNAEILAQEEKISAVKNSRRFEELGQAEIDKLNTLKEQSQEYQDQLAELRVLQAAKERLVSSTREMSNIERQLGEQMGVTGRELAENERITELLRQGLSASAIEALQLAGVDLVSGVDAAAKAAAKLAANLNISLQEALKLKALSDDPLSAFGGAGGFVPDASKTWEQQGIDAAGALARSGGGGGSKSGPNEAELEALRAKYASEQELLDINLQTTLDKLQEFREAKMLKESEFNELEAKARKDHLEAMEKLEESKRAARLQAVSGAFGDVATLMQSENKKLFKIGQAAAIAEAVVNGYSAAVAAWDKGMKIGGPPVAAAFTAASLAKTGSLISGIASASASGSSTTSDTSTAVAGTTGTTAQPRRIAEYNVIGQGVTGLGDLIDDINDALDQGYQINIQYSG